MFSKENSGITHSKLLHFQNSLLGFLQWVKWWVLKAEKF